MALYNLKSANGALHMTKFDDDLNPEVTYELSGSVCTCPAGQHHKFCRHKAMRNDFEAMGRVDTAWFYNYENGSWLFYQQDITKFIPEDMKMFGGRRM